MLLRPDGPDLLCVTQAEHARLAAEVLGAWEADGWLDRPTRDITIWATRHREVAWDEEETAPGVHPATGHPVQPADLGAADRLDRWLRGCARLAEQSTYAAALLAQHGAATARWSAPRPGWHEVRLAIERERDRWYASAPRPHVLGGAGDPGPADRLLFLRDSAMMALAFEVSAMLCSGAPTCAERDGYRLDLLGPGRVVVEPDPFGGRTISLQINARRLSAMPYATGDELRRAWQAAPRVSYAAELSGRPWEQA